MVKHSRDIAFLSGVVYFVQGALGISSISLLLFLRNLGWSISEITTVTSIAAAPWFLKILIGLLSDSIPLFGYRRKTYLFFFSLISAVSWGLLFALPPEKLWIFASLLIGNFGLAATDVVTDGLIVQHSTKMTSHVYQGIAWGSRSLGAVIGGYAGGQLAAHFQPKQVFLLTMFLPFAVTLCSFLIKEKKISRGPFQSWFGPVKRCLSLLGTRNFIWFMALLILTGISSSIGTPFFFYLKETLKFHETFLGALSSLMAGGFVIGSVLYIKWLRHFPLRTTLRWAIILNSLNILSSLCVINELSAWILALLGGVLLCLTILPIMSSAAALIHHSQVEGLLFAILMSIFNLGQLFFGFVGGKLYMVIGLSPLIVISALIGFMGVLFVDNLRFDESEIAEG